MLGGTSSSTSRACINLPSAPSSHFPPRVDPHAGGACTCSEFPGCRGAARPAGHRVRRELRLGPSFHHLVRVKYNLISYRDVTRRDTFAGGGYSGCGVGEGGGEAYQSAIDGPIVFS